MNKEKPVYWYPLPYTSVTTLQKFEACPISFFFNYYCGIEWKPNDKMIVGTVFQNALNLKYVGKDYSEIINSIDKKYKDTAKKFIEDAPVFDDIISIDKPYIIDFGLDVPVRFTPDLLTKKSVIETKFSGGYYNAKMVQKQKQGTTYYHGVKKLFGFEPEIIYQIFDHKLKTISLIEVKKTQKDVDEMLEWMKHTLSVIKKCYDTGIWQIKQHGFYPCELGKACPIKYGFRG